MRMRGKIALAVATGFVTAGAVAAPMLAHADTGPPWFKGRLPHRVVTTSYEVHRPGGYLDQHMTCQHAHGRVWVCRP